MDDFRRILLTHRALRPKAEVQDYVKLAWQSTFGPGHMIRDAASAIDRLRREAAAVTPEAQMLFEPIGGGFCRMNLASPRDFSLEAAAAMFFFSAAVKTGSDEALAAKLSQIEALSAEGTLPAGAAWLTAYRAAGCPAVHHTEAYRAAYHPAYRVVSEDALRLLPLLRRLDELLESRDTVTVAIDGNSASGKSLLGRALAEAYDAVLFHMDDFFLRPEQRTPERFAQPGGNVDYERFAAEVLEPMKSGLPFSYRVFDCKTMALGATVEVKPKKLRIIEGAYSRHPYFGDPYDLRVLLKIDPAEQEARIRVRNGEKMWNMFKNRWIPLENAYFATYPIESTSDFVL